MNIELRGEVLKSALLLEDGVKKLVLLYLGIDKEKTKAVGYKSGTLSYKSLIDLLFDIDVLTKEEFETLLFLVQIRNQFMHNIDCDTFEKAINNLAGNTKKRLLEFNKVPCERLEDQLYYSFKGLTIACLEIIQDKRARKQKDIDEKTRYVVSVLSFIVEYSKTVDEQLETLMNSTNSDFAELAKIDPACEAIIANSKLDVLRAYTEIRKKYDEKSNEIGTKSVDITVPMIFGRLYNADQSI